MGLGGFALTKVLVSLRCLGNFHSFSFQYILLFLSYNSTNASNSLSYVFTLSGLGRNSPEYSIYFGMSSNLIWPNPTEATNAAPFAFACMGFFTRLMVRFMMSA